MGRATIKSQDQFSSPIGAFIFLIIAKSQTKKQSMNAFSSPIGAFIFLIVVTAYENYNFTEEEFSSPIGAFIFLILKKEDDKKPSAWVFVPYRGFYFLNIVSVNDTGVETGFRPLSGLLFF